MLRVVLTRRALLAAPLLAAGKAELVDVRKIWDAAPHNAFTDLIRFRGRWYCAFREGAGHVSPDGALRILESRDGERWQPVALVTSQSADLRDPKLCVAPGNRLMLTTAGAVHQPAAAKHQSYVWLSRDGRSWGEPTPIGDPNVWLWRVVWHNGAAYGVGYSTAEDRFVRLYKSSDGKRFEPLVERLFEREYPNESATVFRKDDTALCLLRRDRESATALLGRARPPYREWEWKDLGVRVGGPQMIETGGELIAATRLHGPVRTALSRVDPEAGKLTEFLTLPSGGDTSYPGLVMHAGLLWVSYYSTHEGKTSIYLARVKL
jgi:hypothetical protein